MLTKKRFKSSLKNIISITANRDGEKEKDRVREESKTGRLLLYNANI